MYSDFNLAKVRRDLGIEQERKALFQTIVPVAPSERLLLDIAEAQTYPINTEKAKSELIVTPVLKEVKRNHVNQMEVFSGFTFNVDKAKKLNGICDYLLTLKANIVEPEAPIFCLVEAKNGVIEDGYGQCVAEMYAAQLFNERDNQPIKVIYGCVTNSTEWVFLRLENSKVIIDNKKYLLDDLANLLGIFSTIIATY